MGRYDWILDFLRLGGHHRSYLRWDELSYTIEALGSTPKKVGMLIVLLLITAAMVPIYSYAIGAPQSGAIVLAAITTLSISWAHGTLEPSGY